MAIIFFSIAGTSYTAKNRLELWILTLLAMVTVVVNGVALSAILFRINEWGITPNRAAVLGINLLMLINLLLVVVQLFKVLFNNSQAGTVRAVISRYLPVYTLWALIVTGLFPLIFGFWSTCSGLAPFEIKKGDQNVWKRLNIALKELPITTYPKTAKAIGYQWLLSGWRFLNLWFPDLVKFSENSLI